MKRIFLILLIAFCGSWIATAQNTAKALQAEKAYEQGNYQEAISAYNEILASGEHSASLYYNLGNSYFKSDMLGLSILNYSRALRLDPAMEDARYSLRVASARTLDKVDAVPEFFVAAYLKDVQKMLSGNVWAALSLLFLAISLGGIVFWLISSRLSLRKVGFSFGLVFLIFSALSFTCSLSWWDEMRNSSSAVILNTAAPVQSSPAVGGKDLFVLHEGSVVKVLGRAENWTEIEIANGDKGWINTTSIEVI